jgi:hypothetical protein
MMLLVFAAIPEAALPCDAQSLIRPLLPSEMPIPPFPVVVHSVTTQSF